LYSSLGSAAHYTLCLSCAPDVCAPLGCPDVLVLLYYLYCLLVQPDMRLCGCSHMLLLYAVLLLAPLGCRCLCTLYSVLCTAHSVCWMSLTCVHPLDVACDAPLECRLHPLDAACDDAPRRCGLPSAMSYSDVACAPLGPCCAWDMCLSPLRVWGPGGSEPHCGL
jgi:hypothetical protein